MDTAISLLTGRRRAGTREAAGPAEGRSAAEPQAPTSGAHPRAAAPTPSAPLLSSLGVPLRAHRVRRPLPGSGGAAPGVRCRPGGSAPQRPPRCAPPAPRSPLPGGSKLWDALQRGGGSGAAAAERRRLRGALGRQLQRAGRAARRFLLFLLLPLFPFPPTTFSSPAGSPAPQLSPGLQSLRQRPPRHAEGAVRGRSSRREIWGSPRAARSPRRRDPSGTKPLPGLPSPRRLPAAAGRDCPRAVNQLRGEGL